MPSRLVATIREMRPEDWARVDGATALLYHLLDQAEILFESIREALGAGGRAAALTPEQEAALRGAAGAAVVARLALWSMAFKGYPAEEAAQLVGFLGERCRAIREAEELLPAGALRRAAGLLAAVDGRGTGEAWYDGHLGALARRLAAETAREAGIDDRRAEALLARLMGFHAPASRDFLRLVVP